MPAHSIETVPVSVLRDYARTTLGLELADTTKRNDIIGKMRSVGFTADMIEVPGDPEQLQRPEATAADENGPVRFKRDAQGQIVKGDGGLPVKEYRILIPKEDKPGGEEPVYVSVNGVAMWITRGEQHWVDEKYVEALKNAVNFVYPQYEDGLGGLGTPREVQSYPYQIAI
jgi:hypothetical protein